LLDVERVMPAKQVDHGTAITESSTRAAASALDSSVERSAGGSRSEDFERGSISANSVLFGQVSAESAVTAVVRRLRAAVGLGLLSDGDRLPREADLVRQLGVRAFSVREALEILRGEGLIVTRAGKNGGSFVSYGTDRALLTSTELRRMSSMELRDLGDWRQMLLSASASLAAQRATESNVSRLRTSIDALGSAETELEARRAHGRFHIELAAAAQSTRMTKAELGLYEEFDWLFGAVLADDGRRLEAVQELAAIADAVASRLPVDAQAAVERYCGSTIDALVKLRLASLASQGDPASVEVDGRTIANEISRILAAIARSLDTISGVTQRAMAGVTDESELRARLSRAVMSAAVDSDLELHGLGYLGAPGLLPGSEYFIAWWDLTPDGLVNDGTHVLDPKRDDFYDYTTYEFYTVPELTGQLHAHGPYVDYGGTNEYIVTFSSPVMADGKFIGVAAADIPVTTLERHLAPWLAVSDDPCLLINAERRVIVANVVDYAVGDVLPEFDDLEIEAASPVGWSVVHLNRA
jgi:DNA-binding FadR family transcriptional regulator